MPPPRSQSSPKRFRNISMCREIKYPSPPNSSSSFNISHFSPHSPMHLLPDPPTANTTTANITDFLEADTDMVEQLLHDGFILQDLSVMPAIDTTPHTPSTDAPTHTDAPPRAWVSTRCTSTSTCNMWVRVLDYRMSTSTSTGWWVQVRVPVYDLHSI